MLKYLFLDTTEYLSCALLTESESDPGLLGKLRVLLHAPDMKLLIPEVVQLEYEAAKGEILEQTRQQLGGLKKSLNEARLRSTHDKERIEELLNKLQAERVETLAEATRLVEAIWRDRNSVTLALTPEVLVHGYLRSLRGLKPTEQRNRIEPDCLIVEGIAEYLRDAGQDSELHFCTQNKIHFCAGLGNPTDLHADIAACIGVRTYMYVGLPKLLEAFGQEITEQSKAMYREIQDAIVVLNASLGVAAQTLQSSVDEFCKQAQESFESVAANWRGIRNLLSHAPLDTGQTNEQGQQQEPK